MKKWMLGLVLWAVLALNLNAQTFSDEKTFTFDVQQIDLLRLHNKFGAVQVKGTNQRQATLKIKRFFKSANTQKLAAAKEEIYLDSVNLDGELMFFVEHPDYRLEINEEGQAYYNSYNGSWQNKNQSFYKVIMEFTIELSVPNNVPLYISTHRNQLMISHIKADVLAQNHHGDVTLKAIGGNVQAHTHHGQIEVELTKIPTRDAAFDTHHGDIKVTFPNNLSADAELSTRHGSFYTDFDYEAKPMQVSLTKSKKGTKYKLGGGTNIRIKKGGPKLTFKTYHGSIYLLEE